jgi:hypothetical protein
MSRLRSLALTAALAAGLGLAACETATPYQPLTKGSAVSGGFTNQQLDADHFRVTFQGNSLTDRETVETYLLYRAAEVTVDHGFDWFEMVDRHTDKDKKTYVDSDPFYGPGYAYGYWRPYWGYYGSGYGWRGWDPFWGQPFWGDQTQISTVQKFKAVAEIAVGHGPKPAGDPRAFDAHAVMANLGPKIVRPVDKK